MNHPATLPLPHMAPQRLTLQRLPWLALLALGVALLALLPLGFVLWVAVQSGLDLVIALVFRARVAELLGNTALLVLLTVPLCALLSLAMAWLTERSDVPGARVWAWLGAAPLALPAYVHSYAWISLTPWMTGLGGAVLVSVLAYFPFLYLPLAASMRRLDPALDDSAAALGLGAWARFRRVTLPQLRLPLCGGALLIGLHLLAEYGLFVMLRFDTFTTAIVDQFQSAYNGPAANMLAGVLALACLLLLAAEGKARGNARYARLGSGSARLLTRQRLGRAQPLALALLAGTALLSLGVPLLTLLRWLQAGGAAVWQSQDLFAALRATLSLAALGALLCTLAVLPAAWLSVRKPSALQRAIEGSHYLAGALPGIVVALALVTLVVRVALPLYQTLFTIVLAYVLMFLPRALVSLRAGIAQAPPELEFAARSLGRTPAQALAQVTLRLAAPGVASALALVFLAIGNELTATLLLAPNGTQTLATAFWSYSGEADYAGAAPYALLMVLLSLPMTWLLHTQSQRLSGR